MELNNLITKFEQDEFGKQILQKLVQIDGDTNMNRNYAENYLILGEWSYELSKRISNAIANKAEYKGFIEIRKVCEILISEIVERMNAAGNA